MQYVCKNRAQSYEGSRYGEAMPWRRLRALLVLLVLAVWALLVAAVALAAYALTSLHGHPSPPHSFAALPLPSLVPFVQPVFVSMAPLLATVKDQHQKHYILEGTSSMSK
ncbi:unnamed protein product [Parnassius apollo]|uniref:(apollo) hypothetical protein n=1 Tax=Parnassius apollo TaxID=110799 RepID=A0A8S3XQS9_PARAO|nr:unnamed protein product [Parnassius apollo]